LQGSQKKGKEKLSTKNASLTSLVKYSQKFEYTLNNLARSLGEARLDHAAKEGEPLPFTLTRSGEEKIAFIPLDLGAEADDVIVSFVTMFSVLADAAGYEIKASGRAVAATFWNTVKALHPGLEGAFFCLDRDSITPMDNIPAKHKLGWDFALWYAYSRASGDNEGGKYLRIKRQTSLAALEGAAWSSKESLADLSRLTSSIRNLAGEFASKVGPIRKFLKGKGYFQESNAGKKPGAGLYLPEELEIVQDNWHARVNSISNVYDTMPEHFSGIGPGDKIATLIKEFNIPNAETTRKIEEAKKNRLPELLVKAPKVRGKSQEMTIAKGSGLPEKLISLNGGDSVRTVGKVMYSPLCGLTRNDFTDTVIKEVNSILSGRGSRTARIISANEASTEARVVELVAKSRVAEPFVTAAASVYLEVIPDRRGNTAWDGTFPPT